MPHKTWVHNCGKSHRKEHLSREVCPNCGQRGKYDGWQLNMIEAMGAYQQRTGLRPIGSHRGMADDLLHGRMKPCEQCQGRGVVDINNGEDYEICPRCHLGQFLFDGSNEEFSAIIERIVSAFPSAPINAPLEKGATQKPNEHGGYVGGIFIKPKDGSPEAIEATARTIMDALGLRDRREKNRRRSNSTSMGSTASNMKITLSGCDLHARGIFKALVNGWKEAGGTVLCIRPGRIYLKLKTKAHSIGNSARLPRNFNLVVLAAPRGKRGAHIEVAWGLGTIKDLPPHLSAAYLDCVPKVVARFEKMATALPGFEQKGSITRLMIDKKFKPLHTKLLIDGMKALKDAEAKAK